jgi:phage gp36-like protein
MYCLVEDILKSIDRAVILQLLDDENRGIDSVNLNDTSDPASIRLSEQIQKAQDEIDSYLYSRYILPFEEVPQIVKQIAVDLSIYNCYKRRHYESMPETVDDIYKGKVKLLESIQKGTIFLGVETTTGANSQKVIMNKTTNDRIFHKDLLDRYI